MQILLRTGRPKKTDIALQLYREPEIYSPGLLKQMARNYDEKCIYVS
jgi:hypothetical protein